VANRTQAAIWALENGYAANNLHPELPRLEATLQPLEAPRTSTLMGTVATLAEFIAKPL